MSAPTDRPAEGPFVGPNDGCEPTSSSPTTEELIRGSDFQTRLAEARLKRETALAAKAAAQDGLPVDERPVPQLPPAAALVFPLPPETTTEFAEPQHPLAPEPSELEEEVMEAVPVSAPLFAPAPSQIALDEGAAARLQREATMSLDEAPAPACEPGLVPFVTLATLSAMRVRHYAAIAGVFLFGSLLLWGLGGGDGSEGVALVADAGDAATAWEAEPEGATGRVIAVIEAPRLIALPDVLEIVAQPALASVSFSRADALLDWPVHGGLVAGRNLDSSTVFNITAPPPPGFGSDEDTARAVAEGRLSPRPQVRPPTAVQVASGSSEGIGFAQAINVALRVANGVETEAEADRVERVEAPSANEEAVDAVVEALAVTLTGGQSGATAERPMSLHLPDGASLAAYGPLIAEVNARVTEHLNPQPVPFDISYSHVRVYHGADMASAAQVAAELGIKVRDMTSFEPRPSEGLIEIWWEGTAGTNDAVLRTASALPQVGNEAQVARQSLQGNSAWVPASGLPPRDRPSLGQRIRDLANPEAAEDDVASAEGAGGLRSLFKKLPAPRRKTIDEFKAENAGR